jgi:acetyl-CoA acetyltransferase
MPTCLVVYFSQGGATRRVAEGIARGWCARGHQVTVHNLQDGPAPDPSRYDVLGVGSPTHYYRPVIAVSDYLAALPDLDVIEANEAFAAQAAAVTKGLELDPAKVNPNRSGISLGHPVGATGAMITTPPTSYSGSSAATRSSRCASAGGRGSRSSSSAPYSLDRS